MQTIAQAHQEKLAREANQWSLAQALSAARKEEKAHAAVLFSSHLDRLAVYAEQEQLSGAEIIELLRQEAEKVHQQAKEHH
ncbi:DUF2732 family protein [Prodigiosinella aquatilis]|nr:DUF2732 family protein [Prodigiosinella sp. LS101]WJV54454.1 DUF2732 family protein [Prodigiosinella sp. LS101]WJV58816.1 DUF2732 family protein [Pectobacteriaceae bacterium C111]